jgi:Putative polyhydroxyalkanoic acid system protein (PHA_gran_rgn)
MPETLTVLIPHQLGKEEALRRLKAGLDQVELQFRSLFVIQDQVWNENTLHFQMRALGQVVRGTIEVEERQVKLDVMLPWLVARLANSIQRVVQSQGSRLLEKK